MTSHKQATNALPLYALPDEKAWQSKARAALRPSVNAVVVMEAYQGNIMGTDVDLGTLVESLGDTIKQVNGGDLSRLEAMLVSQATALQTMFTSLARRAANQEQLKQYNIFAGLALKAQAQSRATISALVELKYPRQATFVKQANIAHGPQQVNNGANPARRDTRWSARTEESKHDQPELLEQHHGERLDTRTTSTTSGVDPLMETMETVHRPQVVRGQGEGRTKR